MRLGAAIAFAFLATLCGACDSDDPITGPDAGLPDIDVALDIEGAGACFQGALYPVSSIRIRLIDNTGAACQRSSVCVEVPGIVNLVGEADEIEAYLRAENAPLLSAAISEADQVTVEVFSEASCADPESRELCGTAAIPESSGVLRVFLNCDTDLCLDEGAACSARGGASPEALTTVNAGVSSPDQAIQ